VQRRADAYEAAAAAKEGGAGSDPSSSSSSPAPPLTGTARLGSRAHENSPFPELRLPGSGSEGEGEEECGGEGHSLALSDSASDASSVPPRPSSSRHK
jgi:hypothetical protein